jgi:hypothetical protein
MRPHNPVLGLLTVGAIAAGGLALTSPAWAADPTTTQASEACRLNASAPRANGSAKVSGYGSRGGCSDTVTYFWVRVYKVIDWWPDSEIAVRGRNYVQNGNLTATGTCDGRGEHYTHTSTATGASGDSVESGRVVLC